MVTTKCATGVVLVAGLLVSCAGQMPEARGATGRRINARPLVPQDFWLSEAAGAYGCAKYDGLVTEEELVAYLREHPWPTGGEPESVEGANRNLMKMLEDAGYRANRALSGTEQAGTLSLQRYRDDERVDARDRDRLYRFLTALLEPDITQLPGSALRALWVRRGTSVAVRIDMTAEGKGSLTAKVLAGGWGENSETLCASNQRALSEKEIRGLEKCFADAGGWVSTMEDATALGGIVWIVEGWRNGRYYYGRDRGPQSGALHDCALRLFRLSGLPDTQESLEG